MSRSLLVVLFTLAACGESKPPPAAAPEEAPAPTEAAPEVAEEEAPPPGEQAVKDVVQANSGQLKYCYEQQLKEQPELEGRVELSWKVSGGAVSDVSVAENTTGSEALASCLSEKVAAWSFPEDVDGTMSWPFVFKPAEEAAEGAAEEPAEEPAEAPAAPE